MHRVRIRYRDGSLLTTVVIHDYGISQRSLQEVGLQVRQEVAAHHKGNCVHSLVVAPAWPNG